MELIEIELCNIIILNYPPDYRSFSDIISMIKNETV